MLISLMVGTALGFLSGLGIGGGSLLILWLTVVLQTDPQISRSINLLFFIPSAIVVCIFRMKQQKTTRSSCRRKEDSSAFQLYSAAFIAPYPEKAQHRKQKFHRPRRIDTAHHKKR